MANKQDPLTVLIEGLLVRKCGQISTAFKKHSSINSTIKLNGIHVAEPETIANAFNSYFFSIPITLSDNINNNLTAFESYLDDQIPESDNFHQTSIHEIMEIIKNIKNNNSVGWDNISTTLVKTNVMTFTPILSSVLPILKVKTN